MERNPNFIILFVKLCQWQPMALFSEYCNMFKTDSILCSLFVGVYLPMVKFVSCRL